MSTPAHIWLTEHVADHVATVTINYPPANVLTSQGLKELESTLDDLTNNDRVKVIIITGTGRFFVAGADIRMLAEIGSRQKGKEIALTGQNLFNKIEKSPKTIIVAINGICLGGGLELALCCHIRLAAEGIQLGLPEVNLGLIPGFGGTQRLSRIIGQSKATEMILTGDSLSAEDGKTCGLISEVFSDKDLMPQAIGLASRIASKSQSAVRAALQAIQKGSDLKLREGLLVEATLFGELCESEDKQEGLAAFLEKRSPHFKNR
ncbi:MAG TPA: enoyl-CoA hydratase [Nitrospiraceae bacterium]|nr:enoyl-CoA hydratase [Nitrospiraceae bacterium]